MESPWSAYRFLREWQFLWCAYLGALQASVLGELDVQIQKSDLPILRALGTVAEKLAGRLARRPRYEGATRIRIGTPQAASDMAAVDRDVHAWLSENWNETYRGESWKGTALGMVAESLHRRGYDLNRLKALSLDDVDQALKREGHREGLENLDRWLDEKRVKKSSLYSAVWAQEHSARWLAVYNDRGERAGRPYEVVTRMYRDVIAESLARDEPFDKLRQRLIFAGDELAKQEATMRNGRISHLRYQNFIETYLNRDFVRFAVTETAINFNNGKLLMLLHEGEPGRPEYVRFAGGGGKGVATCYYCEYFQGVECRLFASESEFQASEFYGGDDVVVDDPRAQFAVWPGKNNAGREFADWWICCPVHPNCSHHWERVVEDAPETEDDEAIQTAFEDAAPDDRALAREYRRNVKENRRLIRLEKAVSPYAVYGLALVPTCACSADW